MSGSADDGALGGVVDLYLFEMLEFQGRNDWHLFLHDFIIVYIACVMKVRLSYAMQ